MAPSTMRTNVDACPDPETLAAYIDGRLTERERAQMAEHLAGCDSCYFVFVEATQVRTAAADHEQKTDSTPVARSWWGRPKIMWSSAAGLAAAASLALAIGTGMIRWGGESAELRALVSAVGTDRMIEPRLTGGFAHGRLTGSLRSGASTVSVTPDVRIAAAQIERDELGRRTPQSLRLLGLAYLTTGEVTRAVTALEQAADQSEPSAEILSDLSAAYLVRATATNQPEDLTKALTMADRAIKIDRACGEAWFNRSLAFEGLGLINEARNAWRDYIKVDATSGWTQEAREHVRRLEESGR